MKKTRHLYTGHYTKNYMLSESLHKIEYPQDQDDYESEFPYTDAHDFLQGACHLFALALQKNYGFEAYEVKEGPSWHCFCKTSYKGADVFIDVRGATTDIEAFFDGIYVPRGKCELVPYDLSEDAKLQNEWDEEGFAFALAIIKEYENYYEPKCYDAWCAECDVNRLV